MMVKIDTAPQEETTLPPVHLWLAHNLIREFVTLNPDDKHLQGWLTDFEKDGKLQLSLMTIRHQ